MSSIEEQFAQFQAFLAMQASAETPDATTAKVLADAPKPATQSRKAETAVKSSGFTRKLDPVSVNVDENLSFLVTPRLYKSSSDIRWQGVTTNARGTNAQKSMTVAMLDALDKPEVRHRLRAAIAKVDDAAKFTSHPVVAAASVEDES